MRRRSWSSVLLVAVVAFAGCGDDGETATEPADSSTTSTTVDETTTSMSAPDTTEAPATTEVAPTTTEAPPGDDIVASVQIAPDSVAIVTNDGSTTRFEFGTPDDGVLGAVGGVLGEPDVETIPECPAGPLDQARFPGGLTLFADPAGQFVGWYLGASADGGPVITLATGVGIGSTLADLQTGFALERFEGSTLGVEYVGGGLAALVTVDEPAGQVTDLYAGTICAAR